MARAAPRRARPCSWSACPRPRLAGVLRSAEGAAAPTGSPRTSRGRCPSSRRPTSGSWASPPAPCKTVVIAGNQVRVDMAIPRRHPGARRRPGPDRPAVADRRALHPAVARLQAGHAPRQARPRHHRGAHDHPGRARRGARRREEVPRQPRPGRASAGSSPTSTTTSRATAPPSTTPSARCPSSSPPSRRRTTQLGRIVDSFDRLTADARHPRAAARAGARRVRRGQPGAGRRAPEHRGARRRPRRGVPRRPRRSSGSTRPSCAPTSRRSPTRPR